MTYVCARCKKEVGTIYLLQGEWLCKSDYYGRGQEIRTEVEKTNAGEPIERGVPLNRKSV